MQIHSFVFRGQLITFTDEDARAIMPRKSVERRIKSLIKQLSVLGVEEEDSEPRVITHDNWTIFLNPSARKTRGAEMEHCLGEAVGGPGHPYVAVGRGNETYGFNIFDKEVHKDQVYGLQNTSIKSPDWTGAERVAREYISQATWEGSPEEARLRAQLRFFRREEAILAYLAKRVQPKITIEHFTREVKWECEIWGKPQKVRDALWEALERGLEPIRASYGSDVWLVTETTTVQCDIAYSQLNKEQPEALGEFTFSIAS